MGGRSKAQTVGFRYSLGMHLALCHGPIDAIREILVDRRTAWSVTTGGGVSGGGAAVETRIGAVAGMAATAALAGDTGATITFPGTRAGVRIGRDYRLQLANGASQTITLRGVTYIAATNVTSWSVLPEALSFPAQSVEVFEATSAASNAGAGGGRIRIDKPDLFGGESREGGVVGDVDVLMGGPAQGQNDYLAARMNGDVPGYRGLCSLVLRQVYLGINPYLKPWAVRVTRVLTGEAGAAQWYPEKAAIVPEANISDAAIYIALDVSGSMSGTRMAAQKAGVAALIREIGASVDPDRPNDIRIVLWNAGVAGSIERREMSPDDYAALEAWMLALSNKFRRSLLTGRHVLRRRWVQAADRDLRDRRRTCAGLLGRCGAGDHSHAAARRHLRLQHRARQYDLYRAHRQHAGGRRAGDPGWQPASAGRLPARSLRQRPGHEPGPYHPGVPDQSRLGSGLFHRRDRGQLHHRRGHAVHRGVRPLADLAAGQLHRGVHRQRSRPH
jgi:hypothetical protein